MNGIGRDFLKAKTLCCFLAIDLHKQINGGLSVPFFSWIGIDVVHHHMHSFLRQFIKRTHFTYILRRVLSKKFLKVCIGSACMTLLIYVQNRTAFLFRLLSSEFSPQISIVNA